MVSYSDQNIKKIVITGGCGYVGSLLIPRLLSNGYTIRAFDIQYYGDGQLPKHPNLEVIKADVRDIDIFGRACDGFDAVIHLGCISNDASFILDEALSTSVNLDVFEPLVLTAKQAGIKRFIYASSSSVYGVSDNPNVTEEHPLVPLTLYNKYKGMCEPLLWKHVSDDFVGVAVRPATLCGYAPRLRLDLSVNILTNHAIINNEIKVFGGAQMRPNLHVADMCRAYEAFLSADAAKIQGEVFNVAYQNQSILALANIVKHVVSQEILGRADMKITITESNDQRSYHVNSDKVERILGFKPQFSLENAVKDICDAHKAGLIPNSMDDDIYYNVKRLQVLQAA